MADTSPNLQPTAVVFDEVEEVEAHQVSHDKNEQEQTVDWYLQHHVNCIKSARDDDERDHDLAQ